MIYYYWQFKNGSMSNIQPRILGDFILNGVKTSHCWDRSLGAWVYYER